MRKILFLLLVFVMLCGFTWTTANQATVQWDAITADTDGDPIPTGFEVKYKVFLANRATDPDKTNPAEITGAGGISATQFTITLNTKGQYIVGVKAYMVESATSEEVAESNFAWSDNPADCYNNQDFGIRYFAGLGTLGGMRPVTSP